MSESTSFDDQPIAKPEEDRYGIDPFARALAKSIAKMSQPNGTVLAIHGAWGSGKSSAINLIRHHLRETEKAGIEVVDFNCWWFRGEEALTLAFFREAYAALGKTLEKKFAKKLKKLANRLRPFADVAGSAVDLMGGGGVGALIGKLWPSICREKDETVESLHGQVSEYLGKKKKRFLIIIDDIDRLSPDEALQMFRLVKSVGRLPNVIYLLAFDRNLAEKIVAEKYPAEGPHYLEKIIQAGFEIPKPQDWAFRENLRERLEKVCDASDDADSVRFTNVLNDVVLPEMETPRDMVRLENTLAVTWPAVGREVDCADFIALETLRLKRPKIHRVIRENKERVCARFLPPDGSFSGEQRAEFENALLGSVIDADERRRFRRALTRVFEPLRAVWDNGVYDPDTIATWTRQRRACSRDHFDTYFRFSISDEVLPKAEIDGIVSKIRNNDSNFISEKLHESLKVKRYDGSTKTRFILEELGGRADEISRTFSSLAIADFIVVLFRLGDELDVEQDSGKKFSFRDNFVRIDVLARKLVARMNLETRSKIFLSALRSASLGWRVYFTNLINRDRQANAQEREGSLTPLVDENTAQTIIEETLVKIRNAADAGELGENCRLLLALCVWRDAAQDSGAEVRRWTEKQLRNDEMVVRFARAVTIASHKCVTKDTVSQRYSQVDDVERLKTVIDIDAFRNRLEELKTDETVAECLQTWRNTESRP